MFVGYHRDLPVKPGDLVTIKKGTRVVRGPHAFVAGRTYKVKVDHILSGVTHSSGDKDYAIRHGRTVRDQNPSVRWAGSGGYWNEVDINDLPEVQAL